MIKGYVITMLNEFTDGQLEAELERRKNANLLPQPQPVKNPDFTDIISMCKKHISDLWRDGYNDDDDEEYIYETILRAVFGDYIFDKMRKRRHAE